MPDQKISQLTAIVTVDNSTDVLPIVDISANTTKKVTPTQLKTALALDNVNNTSDANKPVSTAQQDALNAKVSSNAAITPGTAAKITFDAKGLVTAGNTLDETDLPTGINANKIGTGVVSTTEFEYLNGVTSAIQTQIDSKQATLVSGTNIKTINSTSLLGSGDITIAGNPPSGVAGAIQFSNGSAFASDAANLFWDDTNNRLGIGTNAPSAKVFIQGTEVQTSGTHLTIQGTGTGGFSFADSYATTYYSMYPSGVLAANRTYANYIINSSASGNDTAFNSTSALNLQIGGVNKLGASINGINIIDRLTVNSSSVDTSARAVIKGSGSTSATTSLLVQNSAGSNIINAKDDGNVAISTWLGVGGATAQSGAGEKLMVSGAQIINGAAASGTFLIYQVASSNKIIFGMEAAIGGGVNNAMTYVYGNNSYVIYTNGVERMTTTGGGNILIGTTTDVASAKVTVSSTTQGFLPPRMTTTQKNAISSPASGLVVYDTTTNKLCCYNGSTWNDLF